MREHEASDRIAALEARVQELERERVALVESENRLRTILDILPVGVWFTDATGKISLVNAAGKRVWAGARYVGVEQYGEYKGWWSDTGERIEAEEWALARALRGETSLDEVVDIECFDGTRKTILNSGVPVRDAGGAIVGAVVINVEITGQKQVERSLQEAMQRLRASELKATARADELQAVLDTVPAAVWIARDRRGDVIEANRVGSELLRRPSGSNVSLTARAEERPAGFHPMKDGVELAPDELPIQAAARFGREIRDFEFDLVFDDGRTLHMLGNSAPFLDAKGEPRGSVGAFIDITTRKEAEEALREDDRRKSAFLAVLSHELRNPLAPIRNSLFVLDHAAPGSEAAQRARGVLHRQTEHLARLVDDLLDITRITHGKVELQLARIDAREAVRRACDDVRAMLERRGVELHWSETAEPMWVDADAARLTQIVANLLNNALKFTQPGGRVHATIRKRAGACEVSVRDNGMGIDAGDLERIFEPFVQAERTRQRAHGGMGIGLALARELALRHGGMLVAESAGEGRGAEFILTLPLVAVPAARAEAVGVAPRASGLSILIVEDNEDAGASLADLLALSGHEVTVVTDGRAGAEAAVARRPDVLICDVGLPGMSGHDVIRAVRAAGGEGVYAIAITGYAQPHDRAEALAAGFDAHLPKPPPLGELNALLEAVADKGAASRRGGR